MTREDARREHLRTKTDRELRAIIATIECVTPLDDQVVRLAREVLDERQADPQKETT